MDVSREISINIIKYLQNKKGQSIDNIAKSMSTSSTHIQEVINKKSTLKINNIKFYIESTNQKFWELALEVIPPDYFPLEVRKKLQICQELSNHVKKLKKKAKKI